MAGLGGFPSAISPQAQRDAAAGVLGIREIPPSRDLLLNSAAFGRFIEVAHIEGSGANENPRLIIAMDASPILRGAHGLANAEIRSYAEKESACYFPRCGFITINFALCIWRYYVGALSSQEEKTELTNVLFVEHIARVAANAMCSR